MTAQAIATSKIHHLALLGTATAVLQSRHQGDEFVHQHLLEGEWETAAALLHAGWDPHQLNGHDETLWFSLIRGLDSQCALGAIAPGLEQDGHRADIKEIVHLLTDADVDRVHSNSSGATFLVGASMAASRYLGILIAEVSQDLDSARKARPAMKVVG
ncbi:hypothetical protein ACKF11_13320 [Methylobacillus sp. Pita2]|uniref:hypothetical protein n=1 Tax=Methylobacillus sp. Pita2 TaxID=3383245 RepID=UPI0038B6A230